MKKKMTSITSLLLIFTLLFAMSITAYAKTVYYPSEGVASGYCENTNKSSTCKFKNLPGGVTIHINYFMETDRTMQIRFYRNANLTGGYNSADLSNNTNGASTTVTLPGTGTYYVVVYTKNNSATTFTYAYDLYVN